MNTLTIPDEHVLPLEDVALGVRGLRIAFVNVFAISHLDGSWVLVDAALPYTAPIIRVWTDRHFSQPPQAIVLTHGHFDHVSAAAVLADEWDVPIYAHPLEFPYLTGREEYPAPNVKAGGGLMTALSPLYPRGPVDLGRRLQPYPAVDSLGPANSQSQPLLDGWTVLHTPGHTPGHVSYFRKRDSVLLAGDAFCTTKPESFFDAAVTQSPELHGPPAYFTSDWQAAQRSVRKLADLEPSVVAPGHGKPLAGHDVKDALHRLAAEFPHLAVPENKLRDIGAA